MGAPGDRNFCSQDVAANLEPGCILEGLVSHERTASLQEAQTVKHYSGNEHPCVQKLAVLSSFSPFFSAFTVGIVGSEAWTPINLIRELC